MYGSKAKALNVKNMKETLVNYCSGNQKDYDEIWMGFRQMRNFYGNWYFKLAHGLAYR